MLAYAGFCPFHLLNLSSRWKVYLSTCTSLNMIQLLLSVLIRPGFHGTVLATAEPVTGTQTSQALHTASRVICPVSSSQGQCPQPGWHLPAFSGHSLLSGSLKPVAADRFQH